MVTELQKRTAQAIVNIFETGKPLGDYGKITVLPADTGGLTFGRSQTTLNSGNLYKLIGAYCRSESAQFGPDLRAYLDRLRQKDAALNGDKTLRRALEQAGADPAMRRVQDEFFDRAYWQPAQRSAGALGITEPLGVAVVYDSRIHGSWIRIRNRVNARAGTPGDIGQRQWIREYVNERRHWLANHRNALLHTTVYRMDAFLDLIARRRWALGLPLAVRGITIGKETFEQSALGAADTRKTHANSPEYPGIELDSQHTIVHAKPIK